VRVFTHGVDDQASRLAAIMQIGDEWLSVPETEAAVERLRVGHTGGPDVTGIVRFVGLSDARMPDRVYEADEVMEISCGLSAGDNTTAGGEGQHVEGGVCEGDEDSESIGDARICVDQDFSGHDEQVLY